MAVPRNRVSNSHKNNRRSHHAKQPSNLTGCSNCGEKRLPHRICPSCGFYDGRSVIAKKNEE